MVPSVDRGRIRRCTGESIAERLNDDEGNSDERHGSSLESISGSDDSVFIEGRAF